MRHQDTHINVRVTYNTLYTEPHLVEGVHVFAIAIHRVHAARVSQSVLIMSACNLLIQYVGNYSCCTSIELTLRVQSSGDSQNISKSEKDIGGYG